MWQGWPIERVLLLFVGLAFAMIFVQVTMFHARQNFRHWTMWIPVISLPIFAVTALGLSFYYATWLWWLFVILMVDGVVTGFVGAYLHTAGVGERVGGYSQTQNFLVGPPIMLPLMISAMSALGLLALFWR